MRWSIVRLIWLRELRDQLRDRRTVFMIVVFPILLYPVAGVGILQLTRGFANQRNLVGIVGSEHLVPWHPDPSPLHPLTWFTLTPPPPGVPLAGLERICAAAGVYAADPRQDFLPLLEEKEGRLVVCACHRPQEREGPLVFERRGPQKDGPVSDREADQVAFYRSVDRSLLDQRKIDLLVVVPPGFQASVRQGRQPSLFVLMRAGDEVSRTVQSRFVTLLGRWREDLKEVRLIRKGLSGQFDEPFLLYDSERTRQTRSDQEGVFAQLLRLFPFILVLWALAGALYPAIDLCAGEKERGTMETLLISPVSRAEIVWGKFLTIVVFSAGTALLNLLSMTATTWQLSQATSGLAFRPLPLLWGVVLLLPLSAFFSALCLAIGAYARSTKEGQYYLMPLFFVTMPLIFLTLAPGVELNPFTSMVPVTGVALLLQRLLTTASPEQELWFYFLPVLAPMVLYSWLALRWAIAQFQREEVLFREAERLELRLWLRNLFREKESLPSVGEVLFCFAVILALRWLSFNVGNGDSLLVRTGVSQLAFVAAPPLLMAVLLTTRPRLGLGLRRPPWWAWPSALMLALFIVPPFNELLGFLENRFPGLEDLLALHHPLTRDLPELARDAVVARQHGWLEVLPVLGRYFLVLAVLPAVCEELAFRGFILSGLLRGLSPRTAILLGSFLFAVYQMNVFQFLPYFVFGLVLGLLAVRTGSVLPAMLFHLLHNFLVLAPVLVLGFGLFDDLRVFPQALFNSTANQVLLSSFSVLLAILVLLAIYRFDGVRSP
jgi:sodium transport system permease protein